MATTKQRMWLVPGYDCVLIQPCKFGKESCKPGKGGSHGRHSAELWMSVLGHEAEVTLSVNTSWSPILGRSHPLPVPSGIEVNWHTAWPQVENGQTEENRRDPKPNASCADWGACYSTSSTSSYAEELTQVLVRDGSDAVFKLLENEYLKLVR